MKNKIFVVGEIIWDIYNEKKTIGGAPFNFAAHAVLCGAHSTLLSAVGDDDLGKEAVRLAQELGVDEKYIKTVGKVTGQCIVSLDKKGVPIYNVLKDAAYDNITLDADDLENIRKECFDALYFGTLIQREPVSRTSVERLLQSCSFENIICDVNLRPDCYDRESVKLCLEHATVIKISIEEEPLLRGMGLYSPLDNSLLNIAKAICEVYTQIDTVILTLGADGAFAYDARDEKEYYQAAVGEKVVSTVGAGDSFAAAFFTSYLDGKPIEQCMEKAARISGFVVGCVEAVPIY